MEETRNSLRKRKKNGKIKEDEERKRKEKRCGIIKGDIEVSKEGR